MDFFKNLHELFVTFKVTDLIDILLISLIIYRIILLVKETRAEQLIKGFLLLLIFAQLSDWFNLYTVHWLLSNLLTVGLILIIVIFQPEIRRAFERLGRSKGWVFNIANNSQKVEENVVDELVRACFSLSRQKIGALIVLENKTGLNELLDTGTIIDGEVSAELLINIFIPNTPLHDGAVIIKKDKILAAAVFLPLSTNKNLSKELGSRHRAALGISERSDALVLVVSEETGLVSTCQNGNISRRLDKETLREILLDFYSPRQEEREESAFSSNFEKLKAKREKHRRTKKAKKEEEKLEEVLAQSESNEEDGDQESEKEEKQDGPDPAVLKKEEE